MRRIVFITNISLILSIAINFAGADTKPNYQIPYELFVQDQHKIHVIYIDPKHFNIELVKARGQVIGRETTASIGLRKNAFAAINAGFFEIGNSEDGCPSLSLIIKGKIFGVKKNLQSLLLIDNGKINIVKSSVNILIKSNNQIFKPTKVNHFANNEDIVLYNDLWGITTLTPYDRQEVIIGNDLKVIRTSNHGDNEIPKGGYILSLPKTKNLSAIEVGNKFDVSLELLDETNKKIELSQDFSAVTGIPTLVKNSKVVKNNSLSSGFSKNPHARTAIGLRLDGTIIIAVAEHSNQLSKNLTLQQAADILKQENIDQSKISLSQALEIVKKRSIQSDDSNSIGLSLDEMSQFMIKIGCDSAINLDGGGSSTMLIGNKIINETFGDQDESMGINVVRPVSDAIIVLPKN